MEIYRVARRQLQGDEIKGTDNLNLALEAISKELYAQFDKVEVAKGWVKVLLSDSPK